MWPAGSVEQTKGEPTTSLASNIICFPSNENTFFVEVVLTLVVWLKSSSCQKDFCVYWSHAFWVSLLICNAKSNQQHRLNKKWWQNGPLSQFQAADVDEHVRPWWITLKPWQFHTIVVGEKNQNQKWNILAFPFCVCDGAGLPRVFVGTFWSGSVELLMGQLLHWSAGSSVQLVFEVQLDLIVNVL